MAAPKMEVTGVRTDRVKWNAKSRVRFADKPTYAAVLVSTVKVIPEENVMDDIERRLASFDVEAEDNTPPKPSLSHLKTKAEARAGTETIQVWILELPKASANDILNLLKQKIPGQDSVDLQHLRRFAKSRFLPAYLQPTPEPSPPASESGGSRPASSNGKLKSRSRSNSGKSRSRSNSNRGRSRSNSQPSIMYLLVCPVSVASRDELCAVLSANPLYSDNTFPLNLREITAPLFAPTTQEQADKWSEQYWPTIYRKSNPFGPHPSIITRAQEEIQADDGVEKALELARKVAEETSEEAKFGVPTGCVVVERANGQRNIIAAAGDARDHQSSQSSCSTSSNPMAHCVMRAIGMVARKRVRAAGIPKSPSTQDGHPLEMATQPSRRAVSANNDLSVSESLLDYPLTATEREHFEKDNLVPNGYLCVDLDVYITHEPCVMCSMAILHSRFGRCVFGKRMPATGALYAENSLGYGLFWRPELNWKFLCWERTDGAQDEDAKLEEVVQV